MDIEFDRVMNVFIIYYSMYGEGKDFYDLFGDIMNKYKNNVNNDEILEPIDIEDIDSDKMGEIYILAIDSEPIKASTYIYPLLYLLSNMNFYKLNWCIEKIEKEE